MLKPINKPFKARSLWGFDIETYSKKNKFLMGSIVGDNSIKNVFWEKDEFIKFIKRNYLTFKKGFICASNLSFDLLSLLHNTEMFNKFTPIIKNSSMISAKLYPYDKKHNIKFIDTFNYCRFSVKKWGEILNTPKLKQPSFLGKKPKNDHERAILEKYNLRDSLITYKAIKFLQKGFNDLNSELRITIASTSMDQFRRNFLKEVYYHPKRNMLQYLYNGYHGGRCETIIRGHIKNKKYYDFNSLYPSVMIRDYPYPNRYAFSHTIKLKTIQDYEGVCKVKVTSPGLHIPYLPFRSDKLLFPNGTFTGFYSFFELRRALELGYKIEKFYHGIVYFKKFVPFRDFITDNYNKRKQQKLNKDPSEMITKLSMNSLYGKFAQKIDTKEVIRHVDSVTIEDLSKADKVTRSGNFFIFNEKWDRIPSFINPIFSIYTTAYARDVLYSAILKCKGDIYYYDTDSLITSRDFETSTKLGALKLEKTIKEGILIKPKFYLSDNIGRCKGLGIMDNIEFNSLISTGKSKNLNHFVKFKEANKRGLEYNEIIDYYKTVDLEDNKRKWELLFDPKISEKSTALSV